MAASIIEIEGAEYVVRRYPAATDDRRARTDANLRAMRAEYASYLPGGFYYGVTPQFPLGYFDHDDAAEVERRERAAYGLDRDTGMEAYEDRFADLYADD